MINLCDLWLIVTGVDVAFSKQTTLFFSRLLNILDIERFCLSRYQMKKKKTDGYEYELTFTYEDEKDLDKQIYDLLQEMDFQADSDCCFIEADMREIGADRSW